MRRAVCGVNGAGEQNSESNWRYLVVREHDPRGGDEYAPRRRGITAPSRRPRQRQVNASRLGGRGRNSATPRAPSARWLQERVRREPQRKPRHAVLRASTFHQRRSGSATLSEPYLAIPRRPVAVGKAKSPTPLKPFVMETKTVSARCPQ